ncbi:MAG: hypothetical protein EAY75_13575 [Bacteroidetes bacterium]|nr:MAG: hypothetical protein EAY75_13575 [Bacteroidota bacterium]
MKKPVILATLLALTFTITGFAQGPNRQPATVEDRVKRTIHRLKPELELTTQQEKDMAPVYTNFFTEMDNLRGGGGRPSPEARKKIADTRNEELKKILTAAQIAKLKVLESERRQPRRGNQQAA